jgi:glycosyltransferase involved in cell wall biosynthesis
VLPEQPLVSVVIPTKNRRILLRQTLQSIIDQTISNWEAIVVDDGSNDGTEEMIQSVAAADRRIRYSKRTREPAGAPTCRNIGLSLAQGEFILFLDSDDLLAPICLEERLKLINSDSRLMYAVGGRRTFRGVPGDVVEEVGCAEERYDFLRCLCMHYPWQTSGPLWRRSVFDRIGVWDESLEIGQDVDLATRALLFGLPYKKTHRIDYYYRLSDSGLGCQSESKEKQTFHLRRIEKTHELLKQRGMLSGLVRTAIAGNYLWVAQNLAWRGELKAGREVWERTRQTKLVGNWHFFIAQLLLQALARGRFQARVFAPIAAFCLPRGYLIHPHYSNMSLRRVDSFGRYSPVHYPRGCGPCVDEGDFSYWRWFTNPARRLAQLLRPKTASLTPQLGEEFQRPNEGSNKTAYID